MAKDEEEPNIMRGHDDKSSVALRFLILQMLRYHPHDRPKVMEVNKHIKQLIEDTKGEFMGYGLLAIVLCLPALSSHLQRFLFIFLILLFDFIF